MANAAFTRELAQRALADAGVTKPPVDLDDIAVSRGLRIERHATLDHGVRAAYVAATGQVRVVDLSPVYERFPIAHELGHALLDEGGAACTVAMIESSAEAISLANALADFNPESTASSIASYLLLPPAWLRSEVSKGRTPDELMETFEVSRSVFWIAINRDRLLNKLRTSPSGSDS